jgi:hypothetical protein
MAKKKEAPDAFGLSLLDVLSNALGGLIILMLIVAVTKKGNDEKQLNLPSEEKEGKIRTDINFEKMKKHTDNDILIIQLKLLGGGGVLRLQGNGIRNCSLSQFNSNDTLGNSADTTLQQADNWMAVRMGEQKAEWRVVLVTGRVDSVAVFITKNANVYCSDIVKLENNGAPLISVEDKGKGQSIIKIAGVKNCP